MANDQMAPKIKINKTIQWRLSIRDLIIRKYGSIRSFCKLTDQNYFTITNALTGRLSDASCERIVAHCVDLIESTERPTCIECIDDDTRESIRISVLTKWRSMKRFCEKHPEFSITFVHNVIAGKRLNSDNRFRELLKATNR